MRVTATTGTTIHLVYYLQPYADNTESVVVKGRTIRECLDALVKQFPRLKSMLFDENGKLHDYVSVFVGDEIVYADGLERPIKSGDVLHILYIIGGG
jgi:molybdopterin synthase sulfur carrier subunit